MTSPLAKVRFRFELQNNPQPAWRVVHGRIREALNEPYAAVLDLANENLSLDPDELLGVDARLLINRDGHQRRLCGIVHRVEHIGTRAGHLLCRVHLAPALFALSQSRDCFIFQAVTADQALAVVLATTLQPWQRSYRLEHQRALPTREYFVQYNESDLDFVRRLMAEEGLAFYFDHSGEREELVVVDANASFPAVVTMDGNPLTIQGPEGGTAEVERIRDFDLNHSLQSTSSVVRDFDWTHPRLDLTRPARGTDLRGRDREVYEYPGPLTIGDYANPSYAQEDGRVQSTLRRELFQSRVKRFAGKGYVTTFAPGATFDLVGHGNHAFDQRYLLTRVEHELHAPEELTSDTHTEADTRHERYSNRFECVPDDVPWRPQRDFARPRIYGVQTATVVGPAGEEIYTDEHGRIKVQFHWDREGQRNEQSSCWVRVAQAWAGPGWGFSFIPRIGMEVIVTFLEGNPDRPLVTGCVYNGENRPPYEMPGPGAQTVSTLKTNSSPSNGGFNELRFEDKAGGEEIYLHAQKDFNEVVEHNHTTHVKNCQTNTVDVDQTETIGHDQTLTVKHNRTKTVENTEMITVKNARLAEVHVLDSLYVIGRHEVIVEGEEIVTVAPGERGPGNQSTEVMKDRTTTIHNNDTLTVTTKLLMQQAGTKITLVGDTATIESPTRVELKVGGASVKVESGKVSLTSGGGASLTLEGSTATLSATTVNIEGSGTTNVRGGGASVVLDGSVTATGSEIKLNS